MRIHFIGCLFIFLALPTSSHADDYVFKTVLMRAAPGKLLALIDLLKEDLENHAKYGVEKPYLMRHSQGDQWDLLMLIPVGSLSDYFSPENMAKRVGSHSMDKPYDDPFHDYMAHQEELFVVGPSFADVQKAFETFVYYHVEMFVALSGKRGELLKQRQMENVYLDEIGRDANLIFTKVAGSAWDCYTIGFYRDIKHYAESADIPAERQEQAALKAGFKGASFIGSYLRELIDEHHDTLAGKVR